MWRVPQRPMTLTSSRSDGRGDPLGRTALAVGAGVGTAALAALPLLVLGYSWLGHLFVAWHWLAGSADLLWTLAVCYGAWLIGLVAFAWVNESSESRTQQ